MGVLQTIINLEKEWTDSYEKYREDAEKIEKQINTIVSQIDSYKSNINKSKEDLKNYIYELFVFLSGIGNVAPMPSYKNLKLEYFPQYICSDYIQTKNPKTYINDETIPESKIKETFKIAAGNFVNSKYGARAVKKAIEKGTINKNQEEIDYQYDLDKRKDTLNTYKLKLEITKLYHDVFSEIDHTVRHIILPEIPGIKAFLYAQGVKNAIVSGKLPSESHPVHIRRFMNSKPYSRHVNFVMNTHDFYTMLIKYYENNYLTQLLNNENNEEIKQNKQKIDKDKKDFIQRESILNANSVFGG